MRRLGAPVTEALGKSAVMMSAKVRVRAERAGDVGGHLEERGVGFDAEERVSHD